MGSELRYGLGKVLGTKNRLALRLASPHYVLSLNSIKGILNIVILTHSHTNIHLTINMTLIIPNHTSIMAINQSLTFI